MKWGDGMVCIKQKSLFVSAGARKRQKEGNKIHTNAIKYAHCGKDHDRIGREITKERSHNGNANERREEKKKIGLILIQIHGDVVVL